jgi:WD40 repeat protein
MIHLMMPGPHVEDKDSTLGYQSRISKIVFSPTGEFMVTAGDDGSVRVWDTVSKLSNKLVPTWADPYQPSKQVTRHAKVDNAMHADIRDGRMDHIGPWMA